MEFVAFQFFFEIPPSLFLIFFPPPNLPPTPQTFPHHSKHLTIVRFGWNYLHRFILRWHLWRLQFIFEIPPSPSNFLQTFPPIFQHFPIVRFGWYFLHRLILGWHFWCLRFFSKFPPSPPNFPSSSQTFPPIFEYFPIVRFVWNFLNRFILGWDLWRLYFFPRNFSLLPSFFPLNLSPYFWTPYHRPIWMKLPT